MGATFARQVLRGLAFQLRTAVAAAQSVVTPVVTIPAGTTGLVLERDQPDVDRQNAAMPMAVTLEISTDSGLNWVPSGGYVSGVSDVFFCIPCGISNLFKVVLSLIS